MRKVPLFFRYYVRIDRRARWIFVLSAVVACVTCITTGWHMAALPVAIWLTDEVMTVCSGQSGLVSSRPANDASENVAEYHQQQLSASPQPAHPSVQPSASSSQPAQASVNLDASQQRFLQQLHARGARFVGHFRPNSQRIVGVP